MYIESGYLNRKSIKKIGFILKGMSKLFYNIEYEMEFYFQDQSQLKL